MNIKTNDKVSVRMTNGLEIEGFVVEIGETIIVEENADANGRRGSLVRVRFGIDSIEVIETTEFTSSPSTKYYANCFADMTVSEIRNGENAEETEIVFAGQPITVVAIKGYELTEKDYVRIEELLSE
jgi:hypothetical protein